MITTEVERDILKLQARLRTAQSSLLESRELLRECQIEREADKTVLRAQAKLIVLAREFATLYHGEQAKSYGKPWTNQAVYDAGQKLIKMARTTSIIPEGA